MFSLREGLNLEMSKLFRIRSSKLEEEYYILFIILHIIKTGKCVKPRVKRAAEIEFLPPFARPGTSPQAFFADKITFAVVFSLF